MNGEYHKLIEEAINAREFAYAPYSNFKVGAAVLMEDGSIYSGCNIENASFGATNCAERTAIFKAISEGKKEIKVLAEIGDVNTYTMPCGICRQVISEFISEDIDVILIKNKNDFIIKKFSEIFPLSFSKRDLNK